MYEPILMMVKDAKNYTFNGDAILVEAKTGSQRALIKSYRKNPPQPYNHQKYRVTSGIFRACVILRMNMKTTRRKTGSLAENALFSPLPTQAISFSTRLPVALLPVLQLSPAGENSLVLRSTASTSKWGFDGWMSRRITCGRTGESEKKDRQPVKTKPVKRS